MTEDETFELLEKRKQDIDILVRAQQEAQDFIEDHVSQLGMMTLRKAFEMGYRLGYCDARSRNAKY